MIGYYAHHHGVGHVTRATSIAAASAEPITVLSSSAPPVNTTRPWITLPLDVDENAEPYRDPSAHGLLHWAPLRVSGLSDRMAIIADWIVRNRPRLFVVDVSVEVALLVRLMGVPVVVAAMPGDRGDPVHSLAYQIADRILAPWSRGFHVPDWLRAYDAKTSYVGAISRFDGRRHEACSSATDVVVLGGAGGSSLTAEHISAAQAANPEYTWAAVGLDAESWVDDVWPILCGAGVVVTHAGQNAIADVACARARAVVIPQHRPFAEQEATARALELADAAVVIGTWPDPTEWHGLLDRAHALSRDSWERLEQNGAAQRAAAVLAS